MYLRIKQRCFKRARKILTWLYSLIDSDKNIKEVNLIRLEEFPAGSEKAGKHYS